MVYHPVPLIFIIYRYFHKMSLLGLLGRGLLFLLLVQILVLILLVILAIVHVEQPQEEVEAILDDGRQLLHDLMALVELVGIVSHVPVHEHVEEGGDLLALHRLGQPRGLVARLLALVGQPVARLPGRDVALGAEGLAVGVDQLPGEDSLVEVGIGLEVEPERDGGLAGAFNKLDVLQVLQGLLVLLSDEGRHSAVLQGCVPVPVDDLPLCWRRLLSGLEVVLEGFKLRGQWVLSLDELRGLGRDGLTLSRSGLILSVNALCTFCISISCSQSSCSRCLRREWRAATGTRSVSGSATMRSSIVGYWVYIINYMWMEANAHYLQAQESTIYRARRPKQRRGNGEDRDAMMLVVGYAICWGRLDVVYRSCSKGTAQYGFPLLHSLVHLALEPLKIPPITSTNRHASFGLPPYLRDHSSQAFRVLLILHYQQIILRLRWVVNGWVIYSFCMQSLEAKQRYLRENIPEHQYEDFFTYLEEHVGNQDIDRWSAEFVIQVVKDFNETQQDQSSPMETSFYNYQHASDQPKVPPVVVPTPPVIQAQHQPKQKQQPSKQKQQVKGQVLKPKVDLKISKAETSSMEGRPNSALDLFDSVFDSSNKPIKNQPTKQDPPKQAITSKPAMDTLKFNAFDSNQFWSSAGINKGGNISSNHKLSKSNVDFTNFDFWSQPQQKGQQEFKTVSIEPPLSSRTNTNNNEKNKISAIPSFDQLLMQMKEEIKQDRKDKREKEEPRIPPKEKQKQKDKQSKAPSPYLKKNYPEQRIASPAINIIKVAYEGETIFKTDFKDSVKCFPSAQRKQLKGKQLSVSIEGHTVVNRTFLMPDYVMYSIRVQPINILIQRNYEDFTRLRAVLADFFPGTKLAYLEGSSWFGATNAEHVKRQKAMLEYFLNDLLRNKQVCNSRFVEDFLMLPDHKRIKRKFEEFQKLERPKSLEELCLLEGRVHVNLSQHQRQYQEHLKKYQQRMVEFLDRQERYTQMLAEQYKALGVTLEALIDLTTSIIEQTKRFNQHVYGLELQGVQEVFKTMRGCYAEEKKIVSFNLDLVTNSHLPFLTYERNNTKELDGLINNQQAFLRSYLRRSQAEKIDPAIPYTSDKLAYSKVAISTESKSIIVLKYQAGFFGNQLCHQAKRTYESLAEKFRELWARSAIRKQEQCLRSLDFWKALDAPQPVFS